MQRCGRYISTLRSNFGEWFLIGLAGGYLTVGVSKIWVDGISGGRGWIIIALVIFPMIRPSNIRCGFVRMH